MPTQIKVRDANDPRYMLAIMEMTVVMLRVANGSLSAKQGLKELEKIDANTDND